MKKEKGRIILPMLNRTSDYHAKRDAACCQQTSVADHG